MTKNNRLYRASDYERQIEVPIRKGVGEERYRSEFRRDYARVIHSAAFRRLQGKTQLFPGHESDFFRNRLTHSLEVAQVAKSIAYRINDQVAFFKRNPINPEVVEVAGLVHDIGHPPFGHNGEKALDDCMKAHGGFEGNAQTIRILSKIEKKQSDGALPIGVDGRGKDRRAGLNLTFRSLAACLKYDNEITALRGDGEPLEKGYYFADADVVKSIKEHVQPEYAENGSFKTIECHIMDLADDIAYSTYDLEDSMKAGFLRPLNILSTDTLVLEAVAKKVANKLSQKFTSANVLEILVDLFRDVFTTDNKLDPANPDHVAYLATRAFTTSNELGEIGYYRTDFTSDLISQFIAGINVKTNTKFPSMSEAAFTKDTLKKVEVLKNFTYEATIMSSRLKISEHRGYQIVERIFGSLASDNGSFLLPPDFKAQYDKFKRTDEKRRVICDFVAGMTDRYALEFYGRLYSESPQSIFKPI